MSSPVGKPRPFQNVVPTNVTLVKPVWVGSASMMMVSANTEPVIFFSSTPPVSTVNGSRPA